MATRHYGHLEGVAVGSVFVDRRALAQAGVHRATQGGITGGADGSESIVLNAGYVDDLDRGDEVIYTGHGGRDPNTGRQVRDQVLEVGNLGLAVCCDNGYPVRVCRGPKVEAPYGTTSGYRYDGLYRVDEYWHEQGIDGFRIYRYRLIAIRGDSTRFSEHGPVAAPEEDEAALSPQRIPTTVLRIVRDTTLSQSVKELHHYRCQVCDVQLAVPSGFYAEAAHIRPLGSPHNGPDVASNILCLCPNHHVLFDRGMIWIDEALLVQPMGTRLLRAESNPPDHEHTAYHREHFEVGVG